jgi:hypothetical protein
VSKHQSETRIALDLWRAECEGASGLARRQERRVSALLAHACSESPFYRHFYRGLPADDVELRDLPPRHQARTNGRLRRLGDGAGEHRDRTLAKVVIPPCVPSLSSVLAICDTGKDGVAPGFSRYTQAAGRWVSSFLITAFTSSKSKGLARRSGSSNPASWPRSPAPVARANGTSRARSAWATG